MNYIKTSVFLFLLIVLVSPVAVSFDLSNNTVSLNDSVNSNLHSTVQVNPNYSVNSNTSDYSNNFNFVYFDSVDSDYSVNFDNSNSVDSVYFDSVNSDYSVNSNYSVNFDNSNSVDSVYFDSVDSNNNSSFNYSVNSNNSNNSDNFDSVNSCNSNNSNTSVNFDSVNSCNSNNPVNSTVLFADASPDVSSSNCRTESLNDSEKNALLKLLTAGFVGKNINSDPKNKPASRDSLGNNTIVMPVSDTEGVKSQVASKAMEPFETFHLSGRSYNGSFSFGIVLDDTLRIGRCNYDQLKEDDRNCPLDEGLLKLRNSGTSFKSVTRPLWDFVKGLVGKDKTSNNITSEDLTKVREAFNVSETPESLTVPDTDEKISQMPFEEKLALEDEETVNVKQLVRRTDMSFLSNTIRSDQFNGYFQTNCSTPVCSISVYSLFDKYYNSWFSSEMILSMGFPALQAGASKLFNFLNIGPESFAVKGLFPFNLSRSEFADKLRSKFASAGTLLGNLRGRRIERLRRTYPDLAKILDPLLEPRGGWDSGYLLTKGTAFRGWFANDFMAQGKLLDQVSKDPKTKKALYQMFKDLHLYTRAQGSVFTEAEKNYARVLKEHGLGSAEEIAARIEFGKDAVKSMRGYDELRLDIPEWLMQKDKAAGLYKYAVKVKGTNDFRWLYLDPKDWTNIEKKFLKDGSFSNWIGKEVYETEGDGIVLYKAVPRGKSLSNIKASDVGRYKAFHMDRGVVTEEGEMFPIDGLTKDMLPGEMTAGHPMHEINFQKAEILKPEDLASKLTTARAQATVHWEPVRNTQAIMDALRSRGFVARKYANVLDKALSEQDQLLKDFFSVKGGLKWTAYGYGYDWLKRGFGAEQFSAFQLPEEYKRLSWYHGEDKLYADAFLDFFANAGSDDGDLFQRLLQHILPYDLGLNYVSEQFNATREPYKKLTGREKRTKVENLVLLSSTNETCSSCLVNIDARNNLRTFSVFFNVPTTLKNYMLEETVSKKAQKLGQTLISFAYHLNLKGSIVGGNSSEINLMKAIKDKETCRDKIKSLGIGSMSSIPIIGKPAEKFFEEKPYRIGALVAFGESAAYLMFGWSGVAATMLQQTLIAPKLNDCVDVDGGYYSHIYAPSEKEKETANGTAAKLSTEKVFNEVKQGVQRIFNSVKSTDKDTVVSGAFKKQADEINKFIEGNKETVLQATVFNEGHVSGSSEAIKLFSFWFKGESNPSNYKTQGKEKIQGVDGKNSIVYDYKSGKMLLQVVDADGNKKLIELNSAPDIARLNATNTNIPADELPSRPTLYKLPDKLSGIKRLMFEVDLQNNLMLSNESPELYSCILGAVEEQTGLELTSRNLSDAFGKVLNVTTTTHPSIKVWPDRKQIIATGTPNKVVFGALSKIRIYSDRNTLITDGLNDKETGLLNSIQLENGVILVKPETNELIIWLKRNDKAILNQDDVQGLKLSRNDVTNPDTLCTEPAVDLKALAVPGSDLKAEKVKNFNKSIKKMGPFQVFETPTKRFVIYSKLMPDGSCKDFFKVIDKATGKTLVDVPIQSLNVTPNGIDIIDDKGKKHSLAFSADNGIPKIAYNNQPPEPLTMAQGRNGSFWFDPEKGTWYAENAHLLPLLEAFREGALTKVGPNGNVNTNASGNNLSVKIGGEGKGFNLPSLPENIIFLLLFITASFLASALLRLKLERKKH